MKLSTLINAALSASLLLVLSGPVQACEIPANKSAQYSDTDSLDNKTMSHIQRAINEGS